MVSDKESYMSTSKRFLNFQADFSYNLYDFFAHLEIGNLMDYNKNKQIHCYNKLCMAKIENANLLLTHIGEEKYSDHLKEAVVKVIHHMAQENVMDYLEAYLVDSSTFILASNADVSTELFLQITADFHKTFRYLPSTSDHVNFLVRTVVVIEQENLLECAIAELDAKKNIHKSFILCENDKNHLATTAREIDMIHILHWAIENDGIIPYYQGIYNTHTQSIDRYESLMRIQDKDGNIYSPYFFMDIAKKYHIYSKLSELMVRKVLKEAEQANIAVSINLSAFDIHSSDFRKVLFDMLAQRNSQQLLVFELLEDELFHDSYVLEQFITDISNFGAKIAIDDFGSGYSNLVELAQISPQYLKIDGTIIKKMAQSYKHKAVLESIIYLSEKIGTLTVAEHIEDQSIIDQLKPFAIDLFQGFYFAKPMPLAQLQQSTK